MKLTVISGGTATNSLVSLFRTLTDHISYILPISDNGGSTSELIRVVGGPAIGDIRSRASRLIPKDQAALHQLFTHRLPDDSSAKVEWGRIVDGSHELWHSIESHIKELIRPFFIEVNAELLKRSRPGREFQFEKASVGNLFLTGARIFCGSLDSAIELMLRITTVPNTISVLPALNTNFSHHISALLENGTVITGQSQISHPSPRSIDGSMDIGTRNGTREGTREGTPDSEDAHLPFTHPDLKSSQLRFSKQENLPLPSAIDRIFYINPYGQEIHPRAYSRVTNSISQSDMVVFSIGSLYTSTIPVVTLQGIADALTKCSKRVLILNGDTDRETFGMNGVDYVAALEKHCRVRPSHLIYLTNGGINVDTDKLQTLDVKCVGVRGQNHRYNKEALKQALESI